MMRREEKGEREGVSPLLLHSARFLHPYHYSHTHSSEPGKTKQNSHAAMKDWQTSWQVQASWMCGLNNQVHAVGQVLARE